MFWKNWSWPARVLSGLGLIIGACIIVFPIFARAREPEGHSSCQTNLKQIGLGFLQYTQDYDEKCPPIITGGSAYGWADALLPYLKSTRLYQCPQGPTPGHLNPHQNGYTDYPFNANLNHKSLNGISEADRQILSLDGNNGLEATNARYCLTQIPPHWLQDQNSPLYRHLGTANYLFADGHIKWFSPTELSANNQIIF